MVVHEYFKENEKRERTNEEIQRKNKKEEEDNALRQTFTYIYFVSDDFNERFNQHHVYPVNEKQLYIVGAPITILIFFCYFMMLYRKLSSKSLSHSKLTQAYI